MIPIVIDTNIFFSAIYNPKGFDPNDVLKYKYSNPDNTVIGYPDTEEVTNMELLELECDVLAPSALENVITSENVNRIKKPTM